MFCGTVHCHAWKLSLHLETTPAIFSPAHSCIGVDSSFPNCSTTCLAHLSLCFAIAGYILASFEDGAHEVRGRSIAMYCWSLSCTLYCFRFFLRSLLVSIMFFFTSWKHFISVHGLIILFRPHFLLDKKSTAYRCPKPSSP